MGLILKMLNNLVFIFCSVGIIYGLEKTKKISNAYRVLYQKIINYFSELFSFKMALISSSESPVMLDNMPIDKSFLKPSIATF